MRCRYLGVSRYFENRNRNISATTLKKLLTILLLLTYGICSGQNLVPNPSFEIFSACPTSPSLIVNSTPWYSPTTGTTDYYNSCATASSVSGVPINYTGFQYARTGVAYAGILAYYFIPPSYTPRREYLQVELSDTLVANKNYNIEFYVNLYTYYNMVLPVPNKVAVTEMGMYLSSNAVSLSDAQNLPYAPQIFSSVGVHLTDTLNWMQVSGNYVAIGGEKYITIGNFKNDTLTDTLVVENSTSPYYLSYYYVDDVSVICENCGNGVNELNESGINIFPNPFNNELNISIKDNEKSQIILYDLSSRKLLQQTFTNTTTINTEQLAKGMYLYTVRNKNGTIKNGKVIKQ